MPKRDTTKFESRLKQTGNNTGIVVPPEALETLAAGKRPAVTVVINGYEFTSTVGSMKGKSMIPFSAAHRQASGISGGDEIEVELTLDSDERSVDVPDDLASALAESPEAKAAFESLTYSKQKWLVHDIVEAKKPETRARRIEKAVSDLTK